MYAKPNPEYLAATRQALEEFQDALASFLELHDITTSGPRGVVPAVTPREGIAAETIEQARLRAATASGRARAAAGITGTFCTVQGATAPVDPIAAWHTITTPQPMLAPADIIAACGQMIGRFDQLAREAEAQAPPAIRSRAMHPLVWGAARALWRDGHFRQAVAAAAESLVSQIKIRTGRNDVSDTALWQETFSVNPPESGRPRLRWPGNPSHRNVKTMNDGLRQFAAGTQMTIRNAAVHDDDKMAEQDALERLATLSLLARWVEQCELVEHRDNDRR